MDQETVDDYSESGGFPEFSFVSTSEEAHSVIEEYEIRTTSRFSCYVAKKGFGNTDFYDDTKKLKVMWEDFHDNKDDTKGWRLEFDGVPYLSLSWKKFDCHHGQDRKIPVKEKRKMDVGPDTKKRGQVTKKLGCPARVILREVVKFAEFKIPQDTHWYRHEASRKLRSAIKSKTAGGEKRIYIYLPKLTDHKQHLTGAAGGITQRLDTRIKHKIQQLSVEGQMNVDEINQELHQFVEKELFIGYEPPPLTNRRFYPTKTDIRNHIYLARNKQEKSTSNTLTLGSNSPRQSPSTRRSSRKRKLKATDDDILASCPAENVTVLPTTHTNAIPMLESCPEHITEVEISSQETMDAAKIISSEITGNKTAEENTSEHRTDLDPVAGSASEYQVTITEVDGTDRSETVAVTETSTKNASSAQISTDTCHKPTQDQESYLEEPHSEINASTVIENLNLIAQAMEARMSETSNPSDAIPPPNDSVVIETMQSGQNSLMDKKSNVGARCRSLLGQVKLLTDHVQDTDVLETVQDKLLDIVSFMQNHVPETQEQQNSQLPGGSEPEVMNIQEVQIVDSVNFEIVMS